MEKTGQVELTAQRRTVHGKQVAQLRRAGWIPGVIYGHGFDAIPVQFELRELKAILGRVTGSQLISINIAGRAQPEMALVRDVQVEPLTRQLTHVDFYRVSMTERLRAEIALNFVGEAPAVRRNEGILLHGISAIEVECLPADLIEAFDVDLTGLEKVDDAIYVRDLPLSQALEILTDKNEMIVRVAPLALGEVEAAPSAAAPSADVETVREAKAKEKAAEEGEPTSKK